MNTELRNAIAVNGNSITELSGGFWYLEASQKTIHPYAVFSFVSNSHSRDSVSKFEDYYLQINIYHKDGEAIEAIKDKIIAEFDDSESKFNLAGWYLESIRRQFTREMKYEGVYQITVQYKIDLTKK